MKRSCLIIVVLFTAITVNAQYNVVSEAAFKTACGDLMPAPLKAGAAAYRSTLDSKSSADGRPESDYLYHTVTSYQDRSKWQRIRESTFGSKTTVIEEIYFDGRTFVRQNGGNWTEKVPQPEGRYGDAPLKLDTRYMNIEYRMLPDESFKGQNVRVCEKYETAIVTNTATKAETQRESTVRYWISDAGLLKSEHSYRNTGGARPTSSSIKNEWEIDSTIKVAPPALLTKN
jgi:hypothetical protein